MTSGPRGFTTRGRVVAGAAAVMALAAYLFGVQELYCLAAAAAVLVIVARTWVQFRGWDVAVIRQVHPTRVQAGAEARVELTVRNCGSRSTPPLLARDAFDGGRRWARFAIGPLAPGEIRASSYRLPSNRRGVYHLGPLELQLVDPFGLAHHTLSTAPDTSLTVHPHYEVVPFRAASSHRDDDRRTLKAVIGGAGAEFYMLREYVPGDDLRRVHWPSTARIDDLVIRQPEGARRGRVTVVADVRATVHDADSLEALLSGVASLAVSCLQAGLQVRVVTTGGFDSGHHSGRAAGVALLDGLATAEAHRPAAGARPFRVAGRADPVILVTTDRSTDADLESAVGLGGPTGTTVVVFETGAPGSGSGPGPGRRKVRVPVGGSFRSAWMAQEGAQC